MQFRRKLLARPKARYINLKKNFSYNNEIIVFFSKIRLEYGGEKTDVDSGGFGHVYKCDLQVLQPLSASQKGTL